MVSVLRVLRVMRLYIGRTHGWASRSPLRPRSPNCRYSVSNDAVFESLTPDRATASARTHPWNLNPFASFHAVGLINLGQVPLAGQSTIAYLALQTPRRLTLHCMVLTWTQRVCFGYLDGVHI